ncbi:MAG: GNAT family N-acetyltransferase [Alphaproteobacteria bacterium]|nr:GNAT family N-acetyltransferase [Alphaproteobacteria bacterium]
MSQFKGSYFAPALAKIHSQAFNEAWSEDTFTSLLNLPTTIGWGDEFGFLLASDLGDSMEILTLAILPQHRRKGLASQLIQEMCDWALKHKKKAIFLEVAEDNKPAKHLYIKTGFTQTGKRLDYYKKGDIRVNAICMTLSL